MAMTGQEQVPQTSAEAERLRAFGQIAGELIHDLANVVAIVHGRASLALGDARSGHSPTAELERLVETSEDLGVMLRDVLETLRGSVLSPEVRFDPVRVIERTVRRFLDNAPPLDIRLASSLPKGTLVPGRSSFFGRSVLNLLNNAGRHAETEIRLTLSLLEGERPQIVLLVEDDGPGIETALVDEVFRPLVQGDRSGLAGLGLSSVAWAIEQLGGTVRYRTDGLLGGAAFEIRLPAVVPRAETAVDPAALGAVAGRRIVLLEDDPGVQRALVRLLERLGAEVTPFDPRGMSPEEVLPALLRGMPDLVLLDVRTGVRTAGDVWRTLQSQVPTLARRTVFLSALAPGEPQREAVRATGQPVVSKPLDLAELTGAIAAVLKYHG